MKISEAISKLQGFLNDVGDVRVVLLTDVDGNFIIESLHVFDLVELPDANESFDNSELVCAYMGRIDTEIDQARGVPYKPNLALIQE